MPDLQDFAERLHYENRRDYTKKQGSIDYLDGTPLKRPFTMPVGQRIIAIVIVAIGIVIGAMLINTYVISHWREAAETEQAIEYNLTREASIESIPNMASLIHLDDDAIRATFNDAGYVYYDRSAEDDSNDMMLYKGPKDMQLEEVIALYTQGIGSLEAKDASKLLNGSWSFAVDRVGGTSMVVRYVDFSTEDPQKAVQSAIAKQGFDPATTTDSGEDDSGNTYSTGTIEVDGSICTWRVSALPLTEIYSIYGLPEEACYVGVRITG